MASRGRPRKAGKRTKAGRIKRTAAEKIGTPGFDKGTEQTQARIARFAGNQIGGIARAYAMGLLGPKDTDQAKDRLAIGKKLASYRVAVFGRTGGYHCPLDQSPRGAANDESDDDVRQWHEKRAWLTVAEAAMGPGSFRAWELVDPNYADTGPPWLDVLLEGAVNVACDRALQSALAALDAIAPVRKAMVVAVA